MGQGTQIIFAVTLCDLINSIAIKSKNIQQFCLAGFVSYIVWVLIGAFFIYHAQNKMKKFLENEEIANDLK